MNIRKLIAVGAIATVAAVGLTACSTSESEEYQERKALSKQYDTKESLELDNLKEKRTREDNPDQIRYLYVMSFGQIIGYYTTKGKISSNGSQIAPTTELVQPAAGGERYAVESAQDDGSYGDGDPGIFFFTTEGVMVVTDLDYIQSDAPIAVDVPRLG